MDEITSNMNTSLVSQVLSYAKNTKVMLVVALLLVLAGGLYYYFYHYRQAPKESNEESQNMHEAQESMPQVNQEEYEAMYNAHRMQEGELNADERRHLLSQLS